MIQRLPADFSAWSGQLREHIQVEKPLIQLSNDHIWSVNNREFLWNSLGTRIFDQHLDAIKEISTEVLREIDPKFELKPDKRYAAGIYGKNLRYSNSLREGLSETLAWLGNNGDALTRCSPDKGRSTASRAISNIFSDADWQLWGSLNYLLPVLAEADPNRFLRSVEAALRKTPSPFDELFKQEDRDPFTNENYLVGLYWALEGLAWHEDYMSRVCVILAELAEHDPGGTWTNRPANSIITILLPWHPQTCAPIEKRIAAIRAIRNDSPQTTWKVLLSLLPGSHPSTSGSHKPRWRNPLPDDWKPEVTNAEYWKQINQYAAITVEMAREDLAKAKELAGKMDNLPKPAFGAFLDHLSSAEIIELDEVGRNPIWKKLVRFANKHRRFATAEWSLPEQIVNEIGGVAGKLKPTTPVVLHERLFGDNDSDFYEKNDDWVNQRNKLEQKRREAIEEILIAGGLSAVIEFSKRVESPFNVGIALGSINSPEIDQMLLPNYLITDDKVQEIFIGNFVWMRFDSQGWVWVDSIGKSVWSKDQFCQFLVFLPFDQDAWDRAKQWLNDDEKFYWERANVNPYQTEDNLIPAIDKLLEFGRPIAAIDCLYFHIFRGMPLDISRSVNALLQVALPSNEENGSFFTDDRFTVTELQAALPGNEETSALDATHVTALISALQEDPKTPYDELCQIEWKYLPFSGKYNNAEPKFLHKKLSSDPEYFCEIIRMIYRSENDSIEQVEQDEVEKAADTNAWNLLYDWQRIPGLQDDGTFLADRFVQWFDSVSKSCEKSGHLDIAMEEVGKILCYTPADPDGFWINKVVLPVLDDRAAEPLRDGFSLGIFNSRGGYVVDPTGQPERDLANEWREKANAVETKGYPRFASTLRDRATSYDREAKQNIRDYDYKL